jgi:predicted RNA-binding Zn-ribbon protein involved in translation (DUF1610 family)
MQRQRVYFESHSCLALLAGVEHAALLATFCNIPPYQGVACPMCGKEIRRCNLKRHFKDIHSKWTGFECVECGRVLRTENTLRHHRHYYHSAKGLRNKKYLIKKETEDSKNLSFI